MKKIFLKKNLKDYQKGDLLYIKYPYRQSKIITILIGCFEKFNAKENTVTATICEIPKEYEFMKGHKGKSVTVSVENVFLFDNDKGGVIYFNPLGNPDFDKTTPPASLLSRLPEKHKMYGIIRLSRVSSSKSTAAFGSFTKGTRKFVLSINEAESRNEGFSQHFFARKKIIDVELTPSQLMKLLTTVDYNEGIPCTIKSRHTEKFEVYSDDELPFISYGDMLINRLQSIIESKLQQAQDDFTQIRELFKTKNNIGKGDRKYIEDKIERFYNAITHNIPFLYETFLNYTDETFVDKLAEMAIEKNETKNNIGKYKIVGGIEVTGIVFEIEKVKVILHDAIAGEGLTISDYYSGLAISNGYNLKTMIEDAGNKLGSMSKDDYIAASKAKCKQYDYHYPLNL